MRRYHTGWIVAVTLVLSFVLAGFTCCAPTACAQSQPASEDILPEYTVGFLSVADVGQLRESIRSTQLGKLLQDPAMEPFLEDVRSQLRERINGIQERLGVTLNDLAEVPSGEVALAVLLPAEGTAAAALVVDITGRHEQAAALLERVAEELEKRGATASTVTHAEQTIHVFQLPENERFPNRRTALYSISGDRLIVSDNQKVVQDIIDLLVSGEGNSLGGLEAFRRIQQRCLQDAAAEHQPQIRWFVEPFGYGAAARAAIPMDERRRGRRLAEALRNAGFSVIQGAGGIADVAVDDYELLHRSYVYAPGPRTKSAEMLSFPNSGEFAPPSWAPRELATYTSGYCDILKAFDSIGPVFDETVGEGEPGVWKDVLASLKEDPYGPQIDLRNELIAHLGQRITVVTSYQLPITTTSERLLIGIEVEDEAAITKALEKMLANEPDFYKRDYQGQTIWEKVPQESEVTGVEVGGVPGLDLNGQAYEEEEPAEPLLPNAAVTVIDSHLLVTSHFEYMKKILDLEERETATRLPDLLRVMQRMDEIGGSESCVRFFSLTAEEYRPTYELIRQGKMPESETVLGRVLNVLFAPEKRGETRQQRIDGSKLPDFEIVRRHLGPAGLFGVTEEEGWFFKGFTLPKE